MRLDGFLRKLAIAGLYPAKQVVLGKSAVAVPLTGSTAETVLASVAIPAGCMGLNGALRVYSLWSYAGASGTARTSRFRMGGLAGTTIMQVAATAAGSLSDDRSTQNRGSAASQISRSGGSTVSATTGSVLATTVNTANATTIDFTGQLATGTDSMTLEAYIVELLR